jgi:hypothetical protein
VNIETDNLELSINPETPPVCGLVSAQSVPSQNKRRVAVGVASPALK